MHLRQCLRVSLAGLSPRRPGFDHGPLGEGVALGQGFLRVLRFSPVIIPPLLHTQLILTLLLSEGQAGEEWKPLRNAVPFLMYIFHIFPYMVPVSRPSHFMQ